jgi:CRISPR-associated protein Cas1
MLGSDLLGLVAVIDVLEGTGGSVRPVDVKKGRPPAHGPAWEPELVQLCVQGLLLREQGYHCNEGVLYYAETRERREVPFDDRLISRTLALVEKLREVAANEHPASSRNASTGSSTRAAPGRLARLPTTRSRR